MVLLGIVTCSQPGLGLAQTPVDRMQQMQAEAVYSNSQYRPRPYHFGAQPPGTVFPTTPAIPIGWFRST